MNTIKEEDEGSDTAYFSPENDFNDRDDEDGAYDSAEDIKHEYNKRMQELGLDPDDEDNQPTTKRTRKGGTRRSLVMTKKNQKRK